MTIGVQPNVPLETRNDSKSPRKKFRSLMPMNEHRENFRSWDAVFVPNPRKDAGGNLARPEPELATNLLRNRMSPQSRKERKAGARNPG